MTELTPTQRRMVELLADGKPHTRRELHAILPFDEGPLSNIQPHLTAVRKALRLQGEELICEISSGYICYRRIRPLVGT